ncbi:MAG TPA: rhodanese-like domain-containing protein [Burkholderiales bacterium]|nr:rhodanese-like domain-containing protein [Burkholderiales bacterium]
MKGEPVSVDPKRRHTDYGDKSKEAFRKGQAMMTMRSIRFKGASIAAVFALAAVGGEVVAQPTFGNPSPATGSRTSEHAIAAADVATYREVQYANKGPKGPASSATSASWRRTVLVITASVLNSCALVAHNVDAPQVTAEEAVNWFATGRVRLIDVRAARERLGREVPQAVLIQFGPDHLDDGVGDVEREKFLLALARVMSKTDKVLVICNYEVRSTAAVRLMRAHGYLNASSIAGGYMGTSDHPGWQFFE